MFKFQTGLPRVTAEKIAKHRHVSQELYYKPGGAILDGTKLRDANNETVKAIRAGTLLGKATSGGKYSNSVIGVSTAALAGAGTSLTIGAAEAVELLRRVGATGTLTLTGVDGGAAGAVKQRTVTYSAIDTGTGVVTVTALTNKNQIERIRFNIASSGGNIRLTVQKPDGTFATTADAAWSATDATYLAAINSALDTATGVVGGIVASAAAGIDTDIELTLTYSGTGYLGMSWTPAVVSVFPTSSTIASYIPFQAASGSFATGSLIGDTDGTQTPISFIPPGWGEFVDEDGNDLPLTYLPIGGVVDGSRLLPWPADATVKAWVRSSLKAVAPYTFTEVF